MDFTYNIDPAGNASTLSTNEIIASQASSNTFVSNLTFSFPTGLVGPVDGNLASNQTTLAVTNLALATPWQPGSALWLIWSITNATGSGQGYGIKNLLFAAGATNDVILPTVTPPTLGGVSYSSSGGLSFSFTNTPGATGEFSVFGTTNLTIPFSQWNVSGFSD